MIPRSSVGASAGASATSLRDEREELEVSKKDRAGATSAKVSIVISRRASFIASANAALSVPDHFIIIRPFIITRILKRVRPRVVV